jgi:hypothetical protein
MLGHKTITLPAVALLLVALAGCSGGGSERCTEMCKRETECVEEQSKSENLKYDQDECVSTCVSLERDPQEKLKVDRHYECFKKTSTCAELMECR